MDPDCPHPHLLIGGETFALVGSDDETVLARTVHVNVRCAVCGWPFKFVGSFNAPPLDREAVIRSTAPWASYAQDQFAARIVPLAPEESLTLVMAAGRG